jgi:ankyrin repeat protein
LRGANLSEGAGKFNNTPLMTGLMNWNVRIIDYLTERGVDPYVKDSFGFTALKKAQIKNFRTISSMLSSYETKFDQRNRQFINAITSKDWEKKMKDVDLKHY